jgi:hypothetical protein
MDDANSIELTEKYETEVDEVEKREPIIENLNESDVKDITEDFPEDAKKLFNLE